MSIIQEIHKLKRQIDSYQSETAHSYLTYFLSLPALRAFYPMSVVNSSGNAADVSGNGLVLTNNNTSTFSYDNLAPTVNFNGTTQYLSRADAADIEVSGGEGFVSSAANGLTVGGWFRFDVIGTNKGIIGKYTSTGNQKSYVIIQDTTSVIFRVSSNGSSNTSATYSSALPIDTWVFLVLRLTPSTELSGFVYTSGVITEVTNTTSIPATVFGSTAVFSIGAADVTGALDYIDGKASLCFLCAAALSDATISSLFQATRALFRI